MPTTEQVLASHEAALGEQNAVKVSTHYAENAVVIVNGDTYLGSREIALMYAKLINDLPAATWRTDVAVIHEDLAYVEWTCKSATSKVEFGTDTFVVSNGLITRQTASFKIVADN
ncbi:nuclear transport factor 2 family protein [Bordetella tumulicola]|uniref:nuclear transport factor 2 family protein n=1 Tax=Bordetella tumulicola TaxID=1649133 RepID=UPI0039EE5604